MKNKLVPHLIGPFVTIGLAVVIEILSRFSWYVPSLSLAFIGLAVSAVYGGLRSSLLSATIIILYGVIEFDYDLARILQAAVGAYSIAVVNGVGRRLLRRWILETEYYRQKAIDTYNGNRAKMVEALDQLDKALTHLKPDPKDPLFRAVQAARGKLANTLTLVGSWHEMARDKEVAIEEIDKAGGYPWRADEQIRQIDALVREVLKEVYGLRRTLENKEEIK